MLLSDFFLILADRGLDQDTAISYMQDAYDMVIKKIRLDKSMHPLRVSGAGQMGGFKYPVILSPSGSKMAFKSVTGWLKTNLEQSEYSDVSVEYIDSVDVTESDLYRSFYSSKENDNINVSGNKIVNTSTSSTSDMLTIEYDDDSVDISVIDHDDLYPIVNENGECEDNIFFVSGYAYPYPLLVIIPESVPIIISIDLEYDDDSIDISDIDSYNIYKIIEV